VISSIYDLFSRRQRILMLAVCASAAALAPLADTIYIPSLYAVRQDLHTSQELVAATVRNHSLANAASVVLLYVCSCVMQMFGQMLVQLYLCSYTSSGL
jgi:hypothetical protein